MCVYIHTHTHTHTYIYIYIYIYIYRLSLLYVIMNCVSVYIIYNYLPVTKKHIIIKMKILDEMRLKYLCSIIWGSYRDHANGTLKCCLCRQLISVWTRALFSDNVIQIGPLCCRLL